MALDPSEVMISFLELAAEGALNLQKVSDDNLLRLSLSLDGMAQRVIAETHRRCEESPDGSIGSGPLKAFAAGPHLEPSEQDPMTRQDVSTPEGQAEALRRFNELRRKAGQEELSIGP